jgi:hypothetical protein
MTITAAQIAAIKAAVANSVTVTEAPGDASTAALEATLATATTQAAALVPTPVPTVPAAPVITLSGSIVSFTPGTGPAPDGYCVYVGATQPTVVKVLWSVWENGVPSSIDLSKAPSSTVWGGTLPIPAPGVSEVVQVTAYNGVGEGEKSDPVTYTTAAPPTALELGLFTGSQTLAAAKSAASVLGISSQLARVTTYPTSGEYRDAVWMTEAEMAAFVPLKISMAYASSTVAGLVACGQQLATLSKAAGLVGTMHRPCWEMQGPWQAWNALGPALIKQMLVALCPAVKAIDPTAVVVFNPDGAPSSSEWSGWDPGPASYDAIAWDMYDGNGNGTPSVFAPYAESVGRPWGLCEAGANLGPLPNDTGWCGTTAAQLAAGPNPAEFFHYFIWNPAAQNPPETGINSDITPLPPWVTAFKGAFAS